MSAVENAVSHRLVIDGSLCSGHGRCYSLSSALFASDPEGFPIDRDVERVIAATDLAAAQLAVNSCPEQAIRLID